MDPVGLTEIAERFSWSPKTVGQWRQRELLPSPRWIVSGAPAWDWADIKLWAVLTRRVEGFVYVEQSGARHGLIVALDMVTGGSVWVDAWLVAQEVALHWIRDELDVKPQSWNGTGGPTVYRVPRADWDRHLGTMKRQIEAPDGLDRPMTRQPIGEFTRPLEGYHCLGTWVEHSDMSGYCTMGNECQVSMVAAEDLGKLHPRRIPDWLAGGR